MKWAEKKTRVFTAVMLAFALVFMFGGMAYAGTTTIPINGKVTGGVLTMVFALAGGMALAADTPAAYELQNYNDLPVAATTTIYEGSAVGDNGSGYMRALVAGDPFRGFAYRQADNNPGSAGDINVHLIQDGKVVAAFTSIAITNVGNDVYMSDDATFTLTPGSNSYVGKLVRYISATSGIVAFSIYNPVLAADAVTNAKVADDAISLEHLDSGIEPSHVAKYAGTHTSSANGGGVNALTVTGVASTDIVVAMMKAVGSTPRTLLTVIPTTNTLTFTFSGDPSTDHYVYYVVFRAGA